MKKLLIVLMIVAMASFLFVGCFDTTPSINTAPVITTTALPNATVGTAYTAAVAATDPDGDALTFTLTTGPTGMVISTAGAISGWTPTATGTESITVAVTDGTDSVSAVFTITVEAAGIGPLPSTSPTILDIQKSDGVTSIVDLTSTKTQYINKTEAGTSILVKGIAGPKALVQVYIDSAATPVAVGEATKTGLFSVAVAETALGADSLVAKTLHATSTELGLEESAASNVATFILDTDLPGIKEVKFTALEFAVDGEAEATVASPGTCVNPALIVNPADIVTGTWTVEVVTQVAGIDYEVEITDPDGETTTYAGLLGDDIFAPDAPIPGVSFQLKPALVTIVTGSGMVFADDDPDTITAGADLDVFVEDDVIIVTGSDDNDGVYTLGIDATATVITLVATDTLDDETVVGDVVIKLSSELIVGQQSEIVCTAEVDAILDRATLEFDETITYAAATATTCVYGGVVDGDPSIYKESNNTGYWWGTDMPLVNITAGTPYTITVYGVKDPAGNVGGTEDVPLTKSAIAGAASATLLEP